MQIQSAVYSVNGTRIEMERVETSRGERVRIRLEHKDRFGDSYEVNPALLYNSPDEDDRIRRMAKEIYGYRPTNSDVYALAQEISRFATR